MKKGFAFVLACALLLACALPAFAAPEAESFGAYKHVFIIGVDGAGGFFGRADTPEFNRIFSSGAVTCTAAAETVTVSAENWGAILCGVSYLAHGIDNGRAASEERTGNVRCPTVFSLARSAFPNAALASFVNWEPINHGIIENDIGVLKETRDTDEAVTDAICDYFNGGGAPAVFFVQFDSVDGAGHGYGCESEEYFNQLSVVDGLVGRVYDAACANGLMDDGLFIVVSDHGHTPQGGHGGISKTESEVTVAVAGKTVVSGGALDAETRNRDVAAIALYALGIERPSHMTARLPADLFGNVAGEARPQGGDPREAVSVRFPLLAPVTWSGFSLLLYLTALVCALAVLLFAAAVSLRAAVNKRGPFGLCVFLLVLLSAAAGTYASRLFVLWENLVLYACVDAVFLLAVAGVVFAALYARNGFTLPKGRRAAGAALLSLFLAAAPYEVIVLLINTVIYRSARPTHSITLSAFVQAALVSAALLVILVSLRRNSESGRKAR